VKAMKLYIVAYRKYDSMFDEYDTEIVRVFKNEINAEQLKNTKEGVSMDYFIIETESGDF
jgi:hypothetical protein